MTKPTNDQIIVGQIIKTKNLLQMVKSFIVILKGEAYAHPQS